MAPMGDPNCVEPACADKLSFFKMSAGKKKTKKEATNPEVPKDCPLDRQELGAATWGLVRAMLIDNGDLYVELIYTCSQLHSMGIYYPEKPSPEYQAKAKSFIETLALMYPCVHCAEDFQKEVAKSPPR